MGDSRGKNGSVDRSAPAHLKKLLASEPGQNLSEYCLITALIALVALVILVAASGGLHNIWQLASTTTNAVNLSSAGTVAGP